MDKQMIEEMAKEIAKTLFDDCLLNNGGKCEDCECNREETKEYDCQSYLVAKKLLEKYQPKITEGAVVLTGTETETEEYLEDLLIEFDEMSFYPATLMPNAEECAREWKRKLIYAIGQLKKEMLKDCIESNKLARETYYKQGCKETAEKFAERLKSEVLNFCGTVEENGYFETGKRCFCEDIDEICKEITEGLK